MFTLTSLASPAHSASRRELVQSLVSVIAMIISPAKKVLTGALNLLPSVCQGSQLDTPCMEAQATGANGQHPSSHSQVGGGSCPFASKYLSRHVLNKVDIYPLGK